MAKRGVDHKFAVKIAASGRRVTRFEMVDGVMVRVVYQKVPPSGFARVKAAGKE